MGGTSAVDIITYVGVPLAVLGVLPTLYTCVKSLLTLRDIRKLLDRNGVAAITRSSLLSGIIEVEIPRKSIIPLEREDPPYFEIADTTSTLKGGSWTLLNWRELSIGVKSYRFQYHDELCQPQAEVEFEQLVAYLLDLGAVPSPDGFSDLRSSGLWTPAGTKLMLSPCTSDAVLSVTTSEDSDGILSLALEWREQWHKRNVNDLPPYWTRLSPPIEVLPATPPEVDNETGIHQNEIKLTKEPEAEKKIEHTAMLSVQHEKQPCHHSRTSLHTRLSYQSKHSNPFIAEHDARSFLGPIDADHKRSMSMVSFRPTHEGPIRLRLGSLGLDEASYEDMPKKKIRLPHLRSHHNEPNARALWFACAVTALGAPQGGLWAYGIPEDIIAFSKRESIPGGALVLLGLISEEAIPEWRTVTVYDNKMEEHEEWLKRQKHMQRAMDDLKLTPQERAQQFHKRAREENLERQAEGRRKEVEAEQRKETELKEALSSQRVGISVVAEANRLWLIKKDNVHDEADMEAIVERVLWEMAKEEETARAIAGMLDAWKSWTEGGGMTKAQFELIKNQQLTFAYAACVLCLISQASGSLSGRIVSDLQECLRMWRKVRLG
ncbi:hypothetical protein EJ08DRAFT_652953 [Tothia fuscella]|uniref:Uncharacterized protein n=1 Tax=Tothia fuscella TaxID=1048955 RepID=A0A9P4TUM5_9PEZI|nr:hypothetical protein EJ08DRAFT_652953 [Tothia fuscella]